MPKHKTHRYVDKLFLGKPYGEVHRAIDRPYLFLGRKHRRIFHKPQEAYIIGSLASTDPCGGLAGLLHVWLDERCSRNRDFKKCVEFLAKQDAMRKKRMSQWKKLLKKRK